MSVTTRLLASLICALFIASVASILLLHQTQSRPERTLVIPDQFLHFGHVAQKPKLMLELPIVNLTDNSVNIRGFRTSCGCTSVSPRSLVIPARGQELIKVGIDLESGPSFTKNKRDLVLELAANVDGDFLRPWLISGTVCSPIVASPGSLWMTLDRSEGPFEDSFVVRTDPEDRISNIAVTGLDNHVETTVSRHKEKLNEFRVVISPEVDQMKGEFSWTATIVGTNEAGAKCATIQYRIAGQVLEDVRPFPGTLLLNKMAVGPGGVLQNTVSLCDRHGRTLENVQVLLPMPRALQVTLPSTPGKCLDVRCNRRSEHFEQSPNTVERLRLRVKVKGEPEPVDVVIPVKLI